jgi:urocanate hydratase
MSDISVFQQQILEGVPEELTNNPRGRNHEFPHAPKRNVENILSLEEKKLALRNALRYFPKHQHKTLISEFADELNTYGRIYMYRLKPAYEMYARPIDYYPHISKQAAAIMLMIQNNLDPKVAKYPDELITYGGNGAVFQNWAQYRLTMQYLAELGSVLRASSRPISFQ